MPAKGLRMMLWIGTYCGGLFTQSYIRWNIFFFIGCLCLATAYTLAWCKMKIWWENLSAPLKSRKIFVLQKKSDPKGCFFLGGGWWSLKLMAQDSAGAHACANYECVCAVPLHDGGNSPLGWQRNFCKLNAARSWKMEFVMCGFWVFHISPNTWII